ncbi:MAG: hypothetical protein AVO33_00340 [delta proteobacterium ML8_F1]|nr:MAG: hypothetical protein AVO33_00340 [delta proteobacterium ML8_F1]
MDRRIKTGELTRMGLLIALAVVLSRFNANNPATGSSTRFGYSFIVFLSGLWFGPLKGGIVGIVSNLLSFFLFDASTGPFHPGFTLNAFLAGFLPGLYFHGLRHHPIRRDFTAPTFLFLILAYSASVLYVWQVRAYAGWLKTALSVFAFLTAAGLFFFLRSNREKIRLPKGAPFSFDKILFIGFVYKFINSVLLAPLWLSQLFGKTYNFYFPIRLVKFPFEALLVSITAYAIQSRIGYEPDRIRNDSTPLFKDSHIFKKCQKP